MLNSRELLSDVLEEVGKNVQLAYDLHPAFNSHHEAYAIILEELDEYWDEVRAIKDMNNPHNKEALRKELRHVATTAIKAILSLDL